MDGFIKRNLNSCITIFLILTGIWFIYESRHNNCFWNANATDIVTIVIGTVIAFYLTENMTDLRRRNDCIEHIIIEIENFVSNEDNFKINRTTFIRQASCANRIKYLQDASFSDIKSDIEFIEKHYDEIRKLYSENSNNEDNLNDVRGDIDKHKIHIIDKCVKIRTSLYRTK